MELVTIGTQSFFFFARSTHHNGCTLTWGKKINDVKNKINTLFQQKNKNLSDGEISQKLQKEEVDTTLSTRPIYKGKLNPITQTFTGAKIFLIMILKDFKNFIQN